MTNEPDRPDVSSPTERDTADSDCARWVAEFTADLRRMHEKAGKPSSRQMARRAGYSHTALLGALAGTGRRLPSLELTLGLVQACRGDEQTWRARWHKEHARIAAHTKSRRQDPRAGQAIPHEPDVPSRPRHLRRILLPALGAASTLAISGAILAFNHGVANAPPTYGLGGALPSTPPPCVRTGTYTPCTIRQLANLVPKDEAPQQMKERIAKYSQDPPQQPGPWPFFVYDTIVTPEEITLGIWPPADLGVNKGVKVRTTSTSDAKQVGTVYLGSIVWADCYVPDGYYPQQELSKNDDVGGEWLRIHIQWPTNIPSKETVFSSPTDPFEAYVYAGFTLPFTHNGQIPACVRP